MSKVKVSLTKKSHSKFAAAKPGAKAAGDVFVFQDNEDSTCTVFGVDAAGAQVDISSVASLSVVSSDPTIATVDTPVGATFKLSGVLPGNVTIGVTATWNDGSIGPFSFDLPVECKAGPANSIIVIPGTPIPR